MRSARSRTKPRRGSKPARGQSTNWSPNASACPWQPGAPSPPQCRAVNGSGRRRRRLRAMCITRMLPKLRAKEGSRIGRYGREQLAFSERCVECEKRRCQPGPPSPCSPSVAGTRAPSAHAAQRGRRLHRLLARARAAGRRRGSVGAKLEGASRSAACKPSPQAGRQEGAEARSSPRSLLTRASPPRRRVTTSHIASSWARA